MKEIYSKVFKVWSILGKKDRFSIKYILLLFLISSLTDLIGVASIIPFLSVLSDPNLINNHHILSQLNKFLSLSQNNFLIFLGAFSFIVLALNQFFRIYANWYNLAFAEKFLFNMTKKMFTYYLNKPYSFFLKSHASNLLQKITVQVNAAVAGFLTPIIMLINQSLVSVFLLIFLLFIEPLVTVFLLISLGLFYFIILKKLHNKINKLGSVTPIYFSQVSKIIGDSFGSIKELKVRNNFNYFINDFVPYAKKYADSHVKINLYQQLPGGSIELFAFTLLLVITIFMFNYYNNFQDIIPLIGILVLALKRILPALQGAYVQITQIKYYQPSFDAIFPDMYDESKLSLKKLNNLDLTNKKIFLEDKIELKEVYFKYENSTFNSLENINEKIYKGEFIGIAGVSGSGKTTFLDLIANLLNPTNGKILIDDKLCNS